MKKLLIQPCVLMIIALSALAYGCQPGDKISKTDLVVRIAAVDDTQVGAVSVEFTPEEGTAKFSYAIGHSEDFESFRDGTIPGYTTVPNGEPLKVTFEDLDLGQDYTVFARAYDAKGEAFAPSQFGIKTSSSDFVVSKYYVTDFTAGFRVKTTDDYYKYAYYLGKPGELEKFKNDETKNTVVLNTVEYVYNYWELTPDTEYTFYVKGWDRNEVETEVFTIYFKTEPTGSDAIPNVTFTPGRADFFIQEYTITPNAKCKRIVLRQTTKGLDSETMTNKYGYKNDVMNMYDIWKDTEAEMMKCYVATDKTLIAQCETKALELNAELDVYVVIYDENYVPSSVKKFDMKTPDRDPNASTDGMEVNIEMKKKAQDGVEFDITTNEAVRFYMMDIYSDKAYKKVLSAAGEDYDPRETFQKDLLSRPSSTVWMYDSRLYPGRYDEEAFKFGETYHLVVAPTNVNGPYGDGFGEVAIETFVIEE